MWSIILRSFFHLFKKIVFLPIKKFGCLWIFLLMWSSVCRTHYTKIRRPNKPNKTTCSHEHQEKTLIEREQPPHGCKTRNAQNNCDWAIGQHLLENPECTKMYSDDKFRIIGQARSSFHLGVLESVYIKTQNPVLCRQKEFVFSLGLSNQEKGDSALIGHKSNYLITRN